MVRIGGQQARDFGLADEKQGINPTDFSANSVDETKLNTKGAKNINSKVQTNTNAIGGTKTDRNIDVKDDFPIEREFRVENVRGIIEGNRKAPLKYKKMKIRGLGLKPPVLSASGLPSVDVNSLNTLAGDPPSGNFGTAYDHFV